MGILIMKMLIVALSMISSIAIAAESVEKEFVFVTPGGERFTADQVDALSADSFEALGNDSGFNFLLVRDGSASGLRGFNCLNRISWDTSVRGTLVSKCQITNFDPGTIVVCRTKKKGGDRPLSLISIADWLAPRSPTPS
jgi:hypothetical protein